MSGYQTVRDGVYQMPNYQPPRKRIDERRLQEILRLVFEMRVQWSEALKVPGAASSGPAAYNKRGW